MLAEITNFKGIRNRVIKFDGRSTILTGGNGRGKSSVIDAIMACINSKYVPSEPINNAINTEEEREKAVVRVKIGNQQKEYDITAEYVPSLKSGKITMIDLETGEPVKGQVKKKIMDLFGENAFDIYEFMHMSKREQAKELKKVSGREKDLNENESMRKDKLELKSHLDRKIKEMKAVNAKDNRPFTQEEITKYAKPEPIEPIQKELEAIQPKIENYNKVKTNLAKIVSDMELAKASLDNNEKSINEKKLAIQKIQEEISSLLEDSDIKENKISELSTKKLQHEAWLNSHEEPNIGAINVKLSDAHAHNKMHDIIKVYRERQENILKTQEEIDAVENEIKKLDSQRFDIIKSSELPVEGLTFTDDGVFLNGLPFEQGQVNTQTYLDVAAEISMAMNKKLKLVIIREASLFDHQHMEALFSKLNERGYQWIAEVVDPEGGELDVKFEEVEVNE
jgi:DNA repair exonuclease SbcCD ATPase subunit